MKTIHRICKRLDHRIQVNCLHATAWQASSTAVSQLWWICFCSKASFYTNWWLINARATGISVPNLSWVCFYSWYFYSVISPPLSSVFKIFAVLIIMECNFPSCLSPVAPSDGLCPCGLNCKIFFSPHHLICIFYLCPRLHVFTNKFFFHKQKICFLFVNRSSISPNYRQGGFQQGEGSRTWSNESVQKNKINYLQHKVKLTPSAATLSFFPQTNVPHCKVAN